MQTGLTITAQTSPDLQTWTDLPPAAITQIGTDTANGDPIMQATAVSSLTVKFIRLRVTLTQ